MYEKIDKREDNYAKVFALFLNAVLIVDLVRMLINNTIIVNMVQYGIYIGCAIYIYWQIMFNNRFKIDKSLFGFICVTLLTAFISYAICPEVEQAYSYYFSFLLTRIIPALYLTIYIDRQRLVLTFEYLKKYRLLWLLYAIVGMLWIPLHTNSWNQYSMTFGYNLLIPACLVFYCFIRYMKIKWLFYGSAFGLFMLLRGSRASVLCLLVFIILAYVMIHKENINMGKLARIIMLFIAGIIILINFKTIVSLLSNIFPSSRTLALLASNINFDSGRSNIQSLYWEAINSHPFHFNGIFSDRIYYSNLTRSVYDMTNYPHNFIVELFYQWGIPLGIIIFVLIIVGIIKSIWYSNRIDNAELICFVLIMFVAGFMKLFFSASYLVSVEFYLLVGIIICICQKKSRFIVED